MRPIKLILTAFGPYKEKETIDFTELQEHRLFVISGNTGSGKTTIFDAICFAIYGQASGDDRSDAKMLRSHFAEDDIHTSVEFIFELKGRTYQVFRQIAHVKVGNKSETGERNELYEIIGEQLEPITDRQIKTAVNERLQQLIGLTSEQFSQIVMLPQGEFRKLLVSDTENKGKILRNIFKTSLYKLVEIELDGRRRSAKQELDEQLKVRSVYINSLLSYINEDSPLKVVLELEHYNVHQILTSMEDEIKSNSQLTRNQQQKVDSLIQILKQQTEQYHQAKELNRRFLELDEKSLQRTELHKQSEAFAGKKLELEAAKQARNIQGYDENYQNVMEESKELKEKLKQTEQEKQAAEQHFQKAEVIYKLEEQNSEAREQVLIELNRLQGFRPVVEAMDLTKKEIASLQESVKSSIQSLKHTESYWMEELKKKTDLNASIKEMEERVSVYPEKIELLSIMREQAKALGEYLKHDNELKVSLENEKKQQSRFLEIDALYATKESLWIEGQASVIAKHLHDGKPCPVCGSTEHPNKIIPSGEVPSKEEMDQLRKQKAEIEKVYIELKAQANYLREQVAESILNLSELKMDVKDAHITYTTLVEEGTALAKEVDQLKKQQQQLAEQRGILEKLEIHVEQLSQKKDELKLNLQKLESNLEKEHALFEQSMKSIPENIRSLQTLTHMINETEMNKKQMEDKWKEAQNNYQMAKEAVASAKQHGDHLVNQEESIKNKLTKAKNSLAEALSTAGFVNYEVYQESKKTSEAMVLIEKQIEQFEQALLLITNQMKELERDLQDKARPMLEDLEKQLDETDKQVESSRELLVQMQSLTAKLVDTKSNIELTHAQAKTAEDQYNQVKDLFDMIRGDNPLRMSFERYLQIEFLEKIIEAANQRLERMSSGQYVLVRSDRLEKNGKQSGLGLDVFDHYTGQYRDVKTMSGGEKFNASLSLALGMADVIQSYEGGISIETMFIDEGFGSLDEESLNKAVEALIDLQQTGRMVGVISHVTELKQAIPAILEVTKTKEGHSYTRFTIS